MIKIVRLNFLAYNERCPWRYYVEFIYSSQIVMYKESLGTPVSDPTSITHSMLIFILSTLIIVIILIFHGSHFPSLNLYLTFTLESSSPILGYRLLFYPKVREVWGESKRFVL